MDDGLIIVTHKYPKFKPSDGDDALRYLGGWTHYKESHQMYIVNPDDEELMEYYKQFNSLTRNWLFKSEHKSDDTLIFKFGYPRPLSLSNQWQIILYIYSDEFTKKHNEEPKYKIDEYIPGEMTKHRLEYYWENVFWYIKNAVENYAERKKRVMLMSSSPNDYVNRYFKDHYDRIYQKDPCLKWFDTVPDDDCTCTASELIWKKQMTEASQLGTATLTEKPDGLFVKVDYSNLPNMNKSIINSHFGLLSGDFDGDALLHAYCKTDIDTTLQLFKRLEKDAREGELMKKITDNNGSKMEAEPFRAMAWLAIEKVIFNNEATIVMWNDGEKTIVKCQEGETFDKEKGLAMAICKRALGNTPYFNNYFKKWISEAKVENSKVKKADKKRKKEASKLADVMLNETDTEKIANAIEDSKKAIDDLREANT